MIKAIVINLTSEGAASLGTHELSHLPRTGDWIEVVDEQNQGICCDVVQVLIGCHGIDIYVTNPRPTTSARLNLMAQFGK